MTHIPVMLEEAIDVLIHRSEGVYVDCTFGRGGHAAAILKRLSVNGRLIVMDKDPEAINFALMRFKSEPRVTVVHGSFASIKAHLLDADIRQVDGIFLDLGVSSDQLDTAERGFSFMRSGPLDMRMDNSQGQSAAEWLRIADESEIARVLKDYGEERYAKRIARALVATRDVEPLETTQALANLIERVSPSRDHHKHPATRAFQAIRIQVNRELEDLERCLTEVPELLKISGRLVVISFHSLEDRRVKRFMKQQERDDPYPSKLPIFEDQIRRPARSLGKWRAGAEEVVLNPRARSAVMRAMEKIA